MMPIKLLFLGFIIQLKKWGKNRSFLCQAAINKVPKDIVCYSKKLVHPLS